MGKKQSQLSKALPGHATKAPLKARIVRNTALGLLLGGVGGWVYGLLQRPGGSAGPAPVPPPEPVAATRVETAVLADVVPPAVEPEPVESVAELPVEPEPEPDIEPEPAEEADEYDALTPAEVAEAEFGEPESPCEPDEPAVEPVAEAPAPPAAPVRRPKADPAAAVRAAGAKARRQLETQAEKLADEDRAGR